MFRLVHKNTFGDQKWDESRYHSNESRQQPILYKSDQFSVFLCKYQRGHKFSLINSVKHEYSMNHMYHIVFVQVHISQ